MFTAGQDCFTEEWLVKTVKEHLFSLLAEWAEVAVPCSCLNAILQPHGCNWRCGRVKGSGSEYLIELPRVILSGLIFIQAPSPRCPCSVALVCQPGESWDGQVTSAISMPDVWLRVFKVSLLLPEHSNPAEAGRDLCGCLCEHLVSLRVTPAYNNGDGICLIIQHDPSYPDIASTNWLLVKTPLWGGAG